MDRSPADGAAPNAAARSANRGLRSPRGQLRTFASAAAYIIPTVLTFALVAVVWELWTQIRDVPTYIVPAPSEVLGRLLGDPVFFVREGATTLGEALAGFVLGTTVALVGATLMAHSRPLERSLFPLAIMVKVTPIVAVAPLFVIWFGFGPMPKILITALITFFPVLVGGITGFRSVNPGSMDFLRSLNASRREIFIILRIPSSMPYLFAAFRVAIPLSVIGAVIGEWFSADRGLGAVIIVAHSNLDMPTLFGAIFTLAVMGIGLTVLVSVIERKALFWHESSFLV